MARPYDKAILPTTGPIVPINVAGTKNTSVTCAATRTGQVSSQSNAVSPTRLSKTLIATQVTDESRNNQLKALWGGWRSAMRPPIQLPSASPPRMIPMTEVQV